MRKYSFLLLLLLLSTNAIFSQCLTPSINLNSNSTLSFDQNTGNYEVVCGTADVQIQSISFDETAFSSNQTQWNNGEVGNFLFAPDCNNLGCTDFVPCVPAGVSIPQQCVDFGSLNVPLSGSLNAGESQTIAFTIEDFCYQSSAVYGGSLDITLTGSGGVGLSLIQPDGTLVGPLIFEIFLINALSPIPISLLGLSTNPNGDWQIILEDAGAGSFSYTIGSNSNICLDPFNTNSLICSDPVTLCVTESCPTFNALNTSATQVCSGDAFTLSADLSTNNNALVNYSWSGNGVNANNQNLSNPEITVSNTTCNPITATYSVDITCALDGSIIASAQNIEVVVFPEIDPTKVSIDNTTNVQDPNCSINVNYPICPNFNISGNTTFVPGDNGTTTSYTISNGNEDCAITAETQVNCIGTCNTADVQVSVIDSTCSDAFQFFLEVEVSGLGDSQELEIHLSNGTVQDNVTAVGTFTFGPFFSSDVISVSIYDAEDPSCNLYAGSYTADCTNCASNISFFFSFLNICEGDQMNLFAAANKGIEGLDFVVQWYENGIAIPNANLLNYIHYPLLNDRCNVEVKQYSIKIICLSTGEVSDFFEGPVANVYPIPEEYVDFTFKNCTIEPITNCPGLSVNADTIAFNSNSVTLNYEIGLESLALGCRNSFIKTIECKDCADYPGDAQVDAFSVCWGESFEFANNSALVTSAGYEVGYAITTQPMATFSSVNDLIAADIRGNATGPFASPGNISNQQFVNDGSLYLPTNVCGDLLYFTPFVSFACQSYQAENVNGIVETPPGSDFLLGVYQTPGIGGVSLTVPQVPFSSGLVTYDIEFCADDLTNDGLGLFGACFAGEDPLQENSLFGFIDGLPGGGFSNFPNINNVHNSQSNVCYQQNAWSQNPSGELLNVVTVNIQDFCAGGNNSDFMAYNFNVNVNCNSSFPTVCPDCDVKGASIAVRLLPEIQAPTFADIEICEGEKLNLASLQSSLNADYTKLVWEDENGNIIMDPTNLETNAGTNTYCLNAEICDFNSCEVVACVDVITYAAPTLNSFEIGNICIGEAIDLTSFENTIANNLNYTWTIGNSLENGGAILFDATNVEPIGTQSYYANAIDSIGCFNSTEAAATVLSAPILFVVPNQIACDGDVLDLNTLNNLFTNQQGAFVWYNADPSLGGNAIPNALASISFATNNSNTFYVEFTDENACSNISSITVENCCVPSLIQNEPFAINVSDEYQVAQFIESTVIVESGEDLKYKAGDYILLDVGFEVEQNATFEALIDGCNP